MTIVTRRQLPLEVFFCPNQDCKDYGKKGGENIALDRFYGKKNTALLKCKTCGTTFSENRGTPFFGLHTPKDTVLQCLAMLVERGSIRGTARAMGVSKDTVSRWLNRAAGHVEEVSRHLMKDLNLTQVQIDELWSFIQKKEKPD